MPGYFFFFGGYELTRELLAKYVKIFRKTPQNFQNFFPKIFRPGQSKDDIGPIRTM